jgi:glycerol-3-phosphate dehydrogenase
VIGGGINGAGIARDAAGRGLSVIMCEKDDLAQGTSSRSGKLVHGGLRYLEYYEFRLVREALIEREVLLNSAPATSSGRCASSCRTARTTGRPGSSASASSSTTISAAERSCPAPARSICAVTPKAPPILDDYPKGFEYSDCWVDDARLVVLNAVRCRRARRKNSDPHRLFQHPPREWQMVDRDAKTPARGVVTKVPRKCRGQCRRPLGQRHHRPRRGHQFEAFNVRLVKGSHIIVPKFWAGSERLSGTEP